MKQSTVQTTRMTFQEASDLVDRRVKILIDKVLVAEEIQPAIVFSGERAQQAYDKITHIAHVLRNQSGTIDMSTLIIFDKAQRIIRLECELVGYELR